MQQKDNCTSRFFLAENTPWVPYKYHTLFLQAMIDTNAVVSFLDFSLSPEIIIYVIKIVNTYNHSENSGL